MTLDGNDRIWFLTWTTYGSWLPGDERVSSLRSLTADLPSGGTMRRRSRTTEIGPFRDGSPRARWWGSRSGLFAFKLGWSVANSRRRPDIEAGESLPERSWRIMFT